MHYDINFHPSRARRRATWTQVSAGRCHLHAATLPLVSSFGDNSQRDREVEPLTLFLLGEDL